MMQQQLKCLSVLQSLTLLYGRLHCSNSAVKPNTGSAHLELKVKTAKKISQAAFPRPVLVTVFILRLWPLCGC
jgi:hypothetical protein